MTGMRAVIVDDNKLFRDILTRTLARQGFTVAEAEDAVGAWRQIESTSPHLAAIDVMMPGAMDGVGLCRMIRQNPWHRTCHEPKRFLDLRT